VQKEQQHVQQIVSSLKSKLTVTMNVNKKNQLKQTFGVSNTLFFQISTKCGGVRVT